MAERILMTNGNLKVTDNPIIPFIEGERKNKFVLER